MMNYSQIESLSALLGASPSDSDERQQQRGSNAAQSKNNAAAGTDPLFKTVIKSGPSSASAASAAAPPKPAAVDSRAIWSAEEISAATELEESDAPDGRSKPDYDILYKQSLSAEDVFINLSLKDGSTEHCDSIVVKVVLPGATMKEVELEVTQTRMRVRSNKYKLFLHLPHTVNDQQGRAKWDGKTETLSVTLPIIKRDDE